MLLLSGHWVSVVECWLSDWWNTSSVPVFGMWRFTNLCCFSLKEKAPLAFPGHWKKHHDIPTHAWVLSMFCTYVCTFFLIFEHSSPCLLYPGKRYLKLVYRSHCMVGQMGFWLVGWSVAQSLARTTSVVFNGLKWSVVHMIRIKCRWVKHIFHAVQFTVYRVTCLWTYV